MRKKLARLLGFFVAFAIVVACDDDIKIPGGDGSDVDLFVGDHKTIEIPEGLQNFTQSHFTCYIKAPDGSVIKRAGELVVDNIPTIHMDEGLMDGTYQLLYLEYDLENPTSEQFKKAHFGLGCSVKIENGRSIILNKYSSSVGMFGSGTEEDPYIVSSYSHLIDITCGIDDGNDEMIEAVYRQTEDIDMYYASYRCDSNFGWLPIGTAANPFRGTYIGASTDGKIHTLSNLWLKTRDMNGVGFFGYLLDAKIDSLNITNAVVQGDVAVGVVAGCVLQSGDQRVSSSISNCTVTNSVVSSFEELGARNTVMMGGILGCVDLNALAIVSGCKVDNTSIKATCNAGGIVGGTGFYTCLSINNCQTSDNTTVTSDFSGAGGMVGSCDTLFINGCTNNAKIVGAQKYSPSESGTAGFGAGGLCGGSTISFISGSINTGSVKGYTGVGGIIGSTRVTGTGTKSDPMVYNNTYLRYCGNEGNISGNDNVGGLCGEAQFGCYAGYNTGNVTGEGDYVSGGVGNTSLAVVHNTVNSGDISGNNFVSGLVSKTEFGSVAFSQNYGSVTSKDGSTHTGGICAIATNYSVFHHSGNFGDVKGFDNVGGIVGEIGHVDEHLGLTIAQTIMIGVDMVSAFIVGPILGVFIEEAKGVKKFVLRVVSVTTTLVVSGLDLSLLIYPWTVHFDEKELEKLKTDIAMSLDGNMEKVKSKLSSLRSVYKSNSLYKGLSSETITKNYKDVTDSLQEYYTTASNDSIINGNINAKRDELAAEVEQNVYDTNKKHSAISGVAIAATTIFSIVSAVATGGVSSFFTALSMTSTLVGTATGISQMICESTVNAVIVSQCINAGQVSTLNGNDSNQVGGLVGHLADNGRMYDCLNASKVTGGHLVGTAGNRSEILRCGSVWMDDRSETKLIYESELEKREDLMFLDKATSKDNSTISLSDLTDASKYPWTVGENALWHIPDGASFAIPYNSEMCNENITISKK